MENKKINVGGQAVIEGVMIRGLNNYVVAVRKNRNIVTKHGKIPRKKHNFLKWLFVRGFVNLVEMMIIGIKSLMWSAQQSGNEKEKISKRSKYNQESNEDAKDQQELDELQF